MDHLVECEHRFSDDVAMLSSAAGDHQFTGLVPPLHCMKDNVLLQHAITSKCSIARFENMEPAEFQITQEMAEHFVKSKPQFRRDSLDRALLRSTRFVEQVVL